VRFTRRDVVDGDGEPISANGLSWHCQDALEHRHAAGQITVISKERCKRLGWLNRDQLGDKKISGRLQPLQTNRHAFGGVPNKM
jgi:hypothetical protein